MAIVKITYFMVDGLGRRSRLGGDTLNLGSDVVTSVNRVPSGTTEARLVSNGAGLVSFGGAPYSVRQGIPLTLTSAKGQVAVGAFPAAVAASAGADISNAAVTDFMTRWLATLPTSRPGAGNPGWWSNGGAPTYFAG